MTATDLLDGLFAGKFTIEEVAQQFRTMDWADSPTYVDGTDPEVPDDNSWDAVSQDPRLSAQQYETLAKAVS